MTHAQLFRSYEFLVDRADRAFQKTGKEHEGFVRCERHCADCCHAVFGLFIIEATYLTGHFDQLGSEERLAAFLRCTEADRVFEKIQEKLRAHKDDPQMQAYILARERIRCPLLDDNNDCIIYPYRPITCRVYGIPTKIQGKARVCGKAEFKAGESYPAFDLDGIFRDLFRLSKELLRSGGRQDLDNASLLISVSRAIRTPGENLISESLG